MRNPATTRPPHRLPFAVCAGAAIALAGLLWPGVAAALPVRLSIDRVTLADTVAEHIDVTTDTAGNALRAEVGRIGLAAGWQATDVHLDCTVAGWAGDTPCGGAAWSLAIGPDRKSVV